MRNLKRKIATQFNRAHASYDDAAVLHREVGARILEHLQFIKLQPQAIVDLGCNTGLYSRELAMRYASATVYSVDIAHAMLQYGQQRRHAAQCFITADIDYLPLPDFSMDLVFSNLVLPWCPDLLKTFREIQRVLKPEGVFVFATYGPDTLKELRASWAAVDDCEHVNYFTDMHDLGDLLLTAQLRDPVVDMEMLTLLYPDVPALLQEIKALGANHIMGQKRDTLTGKHRWRAMLHQYEQHRTVHHKIPATYEIIYGHAWGSGRAGNVYGIDSSGEISIPINRIGKHFR